MAGTTRRFWWRPLARALLVVLLAGSTVTLSGMRPPPPAGDGGADVLRLDPGLFTTRIDNPFWPMTPGSRWVYREVDADGDRYRVEVTVTERTATVLGIQARVVRDVMFENHRPLEGTEDWYAQDAQGNIWQLGEVRHAYGRPETSTDPSWRAGAAGAQPVLVLPYDPEPGTIYRQRDGAMQVLSAATTAKVPVGSFRQLLVIQESASPGSEQVEDARQAGHNRGIGGPARRLEGYGSSGSPVGRTPWGGRVASSSRTVEPASTSSGASSDSGRRTNSRS